MCMDTSLGPVSIGTPSGCREKKKKGGLGSSTCIHGEYVWIYRDIYTYVCICVDACPGVF